MFANMHAKTARNYRDEHATPPPNAERVDLVCSICAGEFSSDTVDFDGNSLVYAVPAKHSHFGNHPTHKHFNSKLKYNGYRWGEYYTCPNGCKNAHNNKAVILDWCAEVEHLTAHQLWEFGDLLLKLDKVRKQEDELLSELKSYGYQE